MLFNSIDFAVFLLIVFVIYWYVLSRNLKLQNLFIVLASYIFYGWWDWRFLSLIIFSTLIDFFIGKNLSTENNVDRRKALLWTSIIVNLAFLGFFKYCNFFIDNFIAAFSFFGVALKANSLNIILPVGISFYTFQTLSYTIDVFKKRLEPTQDLIAFAAFVCFFPQLVAGPIERATRMLPQFRYRRVFEYTKAVDGLRQILWGLFKKVVIADNCAEYANLIFNNSADYSGSTLVLGAIFFTFQIYCDFSGYSDIAIGTARLFGFNLSRNFHFPYFSRDVAEFWRRWHISLSTWFRDYLYIPLGGSRGSAIVQVRNVSCIFIISGFWHGANWTFIIWGALNAVFFLVLMLTNRHRKNRDQVAYGKYLPNVRELISMMLTFSLITFTWIFFRAENVSHACEYISKIFSWSLFTMPRFEGMRHALTVIILLGIFVLVEWFGREGEYAISSLGLNWKRPFRFVMYYTIIIAIFWFAGKEQQFLYFQF